MEELKTEILNKNILDGEALHHEFASGLHGRKLDFDKIETNSKLYDLWVSALTGYIHANYSPLPDVLVGVANGTNRLATSVASRLGGESIGLVTVKEPSGVVRFSSDVLATIRSLNPDFVLILEDVGTSGGTASSVALAALSARVNRVEVLNTWQRSQTLPKLDEAGVPYRSLITEPLPNYTPDNCAYCQSGSHLIRH